MNLDLPPTAYSRADIDRLIQDVREYAKWYSHEATKKRFKIKPSSRQSPPELSSDTKELLRDWTIKQPLSLASLDQLVAALERFKLNAPTLTFILAAPAPGSLKKDLVSWCRKNIAKNILVSFEFNSTLLGGFVLRYGSRVFDWSFRRQILANSAVFSEKLLSV